MSLLESGEMYLETIYLLSVKKDGVHAVDVAEAMHFSKPSVSRALHSLEKAGYITISEEDHIVFTKEGRGIAKKIYERHTLLAEFLKHIGVRAKTAEEDACKIEHDVSEETIKFIRRFMKNVR